MTDAIAHRGPDGEGFWHNKNEKVFLGHRRLAILDLTDNAAQPPQCHAVPNERRCRWSGNALQRQQLALDRRQPDLTGPDRQ